jgi:acetyl-CoA synthetase
MRNIDLNHKIRAIDSVDHYQSLHRSFVWQVPEQFNIATVCCQRWSKSEQAAVIEVGDTGLGRSWTYRQLAQQANRAAHALRALGVGRADRVAILLPQRFETAVAHMACYQLGAIAMPMSVLFGPEALAFRLQDSAAKVVISDDQCIAAVRSIRDQCPALLAVIQVGASSPSSKPSSKEINWPMWLAKSSDKPIQVNTAANEPCDLIYTSGTTGPPKGALIPHSALIGNLPGFVASQNWFPQVNDVFWSPADWAWTGGLMDALLPTLYFGKPIVAYRGRFTVDATLNILREQRVTNSFLFPTALKMLMKSWRPAMAQGIHLRAIMSAGEAVGKTVFEWSQNELGVTINEMFGQTELNYVVGNCAPRWPAKAGSIGKAYPGHQVAIIDEQGHPVKPGELGEIAVNRYDRHGVADPVFFIGYWNNPQATQDKFTQNWCRTGDLGTYDNDGYLWYQGRADDMFKAAGYRIGPGEIENCLLKHPAVQNVAVVPKPDAQRGNIVKAFIVLNVGYQASADLIEQLQLHVRGQLAPYEYPKEIEFIDALPTTTTGKIQRRVLRLQELHRAKPSESL